MELTVNAFTKTSVHLHAHMLQDYLSCAAYVLVVCPVEAEGGWSEMNP